MSDDDNSQTHASSSVSHDVVVTDVSSDRSSRKRRPTSRYVEQESYEVLKQLYQSSGKSGKKRGRKAHGDRVAVTPESTSNKWKTYKVKVSSLARSIARDVHAMTSYEVEDGNFAGIRSLIPQAEMLKCTSRIRNAKMAIIEQFSAMEAEYSEHIRWPQLKTGFDDDDEVSVDDIMCSLCNLPDEENNDILFCDHVGCLRAYHQQCLDPPQTTDVDADADWFCRQCECMDDCLDLVGEILGHDADNYRELFPELHASAEGGVGHAGIEEEDSEDDVDYAPSDSEEDNQSFAGTDDNESGKSNDDSIDVVQQRKRRGTKSKSLNEASPANGDDSEGNDHRSSDVSDDSDLDSDLDSASDSGGDIEEDELQGLLRDAAEDDLLLDQTSSIHSVAGEGGDATRRSLRARRAGGYAALEDKSRFPEGPADVGKKVAAMVRKGVLGVGEITSFRYAEPAWVEKRDKSAWKKVEVEGDLDTEEHPFDVAGGADEVVDSGTQPSAMDEDADADIRNATAEAISLNETTDCTPSKTNATKHSLLNEETATADILSQVASNAEPIEPCVTGSAAEPLVQTLEQGVWTVRFEDAGLEREVGLETLREFFALYAECAEKLSEDAKRASDKSQSALNSVAEQGRLDEANVLTHKRTRVRLDYAALSKEMFGDKADSDSDDSSVQDVEVVKEVLRDIRQVQHAEQLEQHLSCMRAQGAKKSTNKESHRRTGSADGSVITVASGTAASSASSTMVDSACNGTTSQTNHGDVDLSHDSNDAEAKEREKRRARARYQAEYRAAQRLLHTTAGESSEGGKRRGRPRKHPALASPLSTNLSTSAEYENCPSSSGMAEAMSSTTGSGKKRGRPRKTPPPFLPSQEKSRQLPEQSVNTSNRSDEPPRDPSTPSSVTAAPVPSSARENQPPTPDQQGITPHGLLRLALGTSQDYSLPVDLAAHRLHLGHPNVRTTGDTVGESYWPNSLQNSPHNTSASNSGPSSDVKKRGRPKGSKNKEKPENASGEKKPRTKKPKLHPESIPFVGAECTALKSVELPDSTVSIQEVRKEIEDSLDGYVP